MDVLAVLLVLQGFGYAHLFLLLALWWWDNRLIYRQHDGLLRLRVRTASSQ